MLESLFNKFAGLKACSFIKKRIQHKGFPVNIVKFFRIAFLQNTSGGCFWNLGIDEKIFVPISIINFILLPKAIWQLCPNLALKNILNSLHTEEVTYRCSVKK